MISSKTIQTALTGMLCLAGSATLSAQFHTDQAFWNQPHMQRAFAGSYEIKTVTEPDLTEEEQIAFKQILDQLKLDNNKDTALQSLLALLTPESTAAFDFVIANFYAEKGQLKDAIKYYDQAIAKFPSFLRAVRNSAIMKVREGRFEAALQGFTKAIELGAKDSVTMGLLGLCYVNTDQFFSAESAYREAIMLDPTAKDWQVGLAKALLQQAKYKEGIAVIEQILREDPENDILWSSAANAYLGLDEPETAVAIQEIVDRLGKATPDSLIFMGNIYMSRDLNDLALTYFERAIEMDPNQNPDVHVDIAELMTARAAYEQAAEVIETIQSTLGDKLDEEDKLRILRLRAQMALATGMGEDVIPILEELIEKDPLDGQALLLLAEYYSGNKTADGYARADLYYERATKVRDWEVRALISWARSYVSRERFDKALPLLERSQVLEPQEHIARYLDQVRQVNLIRRGG